MVEGGLVGFGVGVLLTACAAWAILRRHVRRVRAAERRARTAERQAELAGMTSGLAHEIRNPLSTIGLNAQLVLEGLQDAGDALPESERARLINRVRALGREIERLSGILGDFLQFAGQVNLDPRETDLNALAGEMVDFFTPECERRGVRLRHDSAGAPVVAPVDVKLTKQALLNLMINGVQAMAPEPAGGGGAQPVVGAELPGRAASESAVPDVAKELIVRVREGKDGDGRVVAEVHVIDTGPGIGPEALGRIFTPYFTTKSQGTGLGLPTSRRLVEAHGGRIDVHSEPGRGSDFTVILPKHGPDGRGRESGGRAARRAAVRRGDLPG